MDYSSVKLGGGSWTCTKCGKLITGSSIYHECIDIKQSLKEEKMKDNYVFFWNGIYSQWYNAPMSIDGVTYNCCEQYMMHQKALFFGDTEIAEKIMQTTHPSEQKQFGRQVKGFDKDKWDSVCIGIVYKGNYAKFTQNQGLKEQLLLTGNKILVEASPLDKIWGIGMAEADEGIENPANWKGLNLLGWSITLVRQEIKSQL